MKIQNPRRRIATAVGAATIAFAAAGSGQAGAVGGPEYGILPAPGWPGVDPQTASTSAARRPLPLESLRPLRADGKATPVADDNFDWADAGIGATGVVVILVALAGARLVARRHGHLAHP